MAGRHGAVEENEARARERGETPGCSPPLWKGLGDNDAPPLVQQLARTLWACKQAHEAALGFSALEAWVLSLAARRDGVTQHELTAIVRVDPSMITRIVKEMERERGWIHRERDPADNRLMRVYLTARGRERAEGLRERIAAVERHLTRDLGDRRTRELCAMLRTLEGAAKDDVT